MPATPPVFRTPLQKFWLALPVAERREIAREIVSLRRTEHWAPGIDADVAAALRYRPTTVRKSSDDQIARWLVELGGFLGFATLQHLFVALHFTTRAELLSAVYDAFGVEHDGTNTEQDVLDAPVDPARATSGIEQLAKTTDLDRLHFCLIVLRESCTPAWEPAAVAALAVVEAKRRDAGEAPETPARGR